MTHEIIACLHPVDYTRMDPDHGLMLDLDALEQSVSACERSGCDRVLLPHANDLFEPLEIAAYLAPKIARIGFLVAQRPGFIAPTMAARMLATLDQLSVGRVGLLMDLTAPFTAMRQDGDAIAAEDRAARAVEYAQILRKLWSSPTPLDHEGAFYRFNKGLSAVKPLQQPSIFFSGDGDAETAVAIGDMVVLRLQAPVALAALIARVCSAAAAKNRDVRVAMRMTLEDADVAEETAARYARCGIDSLFLEGGAPLTTVFAVTPDLPARLRAGLAKV